MGEVKAAIECGRPTAATVTNLANLLGLEAVHDSHKPNARRPKAVASRNGNPAARKPQKPLTVALHEERSKPLSGRDGYALALHTVNHGLKLLSSSVTSHNRPQKVSSSPRLDNSPSTPGASPYRALQPRSANISPRRASPKRPSTITSISENSLAKSTNHTPPEILEVARCMELGFSFLLDADFQALGVKEMPRWQLETGLLSFVGSLSSYGLEGLATKSLRIVKQRLESGLGGTKSVKASKINPSRSTAEENVSLANLLCLSTSCEIESAALPVAIAYHQRVMKLISSSPTLIAVKELPKHIAIDVRNGPVDLIVRNAKITKDFAKAAKQLEALSQSLVRLGPGAAQSSDEVAKDVQACPSPEATLRLQTISLQIRKLWWKLAKHRADVSHELVEPFLICASAFVRRIAYSQTQRNPSQLLGACLEAIGPLDHKALAQALFPIHHLICSQAVSDGSTEDAVRWATLMIEDCSTMDHCNARTITANIWKLAILSQEGSVEIETRASSVAESLQSKITGGGTDFDNLVKAIDCLSRTMCTRRGQVTVSPALVKVLILGAKFCQRYGRSCPPKSMKQIASILNVTIRYSKTTDELLSWVTTDSAAVFVEVEALTRVVELASTRPLLEVWSVSQDALSLSRIVNSLIIKFARSHAEPNATLLFDDEKLRADARGILLEWQLQCAADLASRVKYQEPLKKLLPDLLRKLAKSYDGSEFPIRRTRAATIALRIREAHPSLIPPHVFKVWQDVVGIDRAALGQDHGLLDYLDDVTARYAVFKLFSDGRITSNELRPHLATWRRISMSCQDRQDLYNRCDDPEILVQQLRSIAAYFRMMGHDKEALPVNCVLMRINQLLDPLSSEACTSKMELAQTYLDLGYSDKASTLFEESLSFEQQPKTCDVVPLQRKALHLDYLLAVDRFEDCNVAIKAIGALSLGMVSETMSRDKRRMYEVIQAKSWLQHSRFLLTTGDPRQSLHSAKRAVQVLHGVWSSIERANGIQELIEPCNEDDKAVTGLTKGISKLQLAPSEDHKEKPEEQSKRGAAFWPLVPLLIKALLHLSDVYTHHGLFNDADYYSQRAIGIAESVGSSLLLSRIRSHRCRLLTRSGRIEEAELCIVQIGDVGSPTSFANIESHCTKAAIKVNERSLTDALELYEKAEQILDKICAEGSFAHLEGFVIGGNESRKQSVAASSDSQPSDRMIPQTSKRAGHRPVNKPISKSKVTEERYKSTKSSQSGANKQAGLDPDYVLRKMRNCISVEKAMVELAIDKRRDGIAKAVTREQAQCYQTFQERLLQHRYLLESATATLETNVTLSLLAESTLSVPGLIGTGSRRIVPKMKVHPSKARPKTTNAVAEPNERSEALFLKAKDCLSTYLASQVDVCSTLETHLGYSSLSHVSMLASAFAGCEAHRELTSLDEAMYIDIPRIKPLHLEKGTFSGEASGKADARQRMWPEMCQLPSPIVISGADFQSRFVDIIPSPWTAVSLCLSEDGQDLFIARYRAGVEPFTLKLPFARHKPGDDGDIEEIVFDYRKGKAELRDIIDASNYTCHNPGRLDAKGAKSKWWKEREDLDRRLHELLINMENIWLGGFKSILSSHQPQQDALSRFGASLRQILARCLPSRQAANRNTDQYTVDDHILELFIGLEAIVNTTGDIEELATDLLYFVVDLLQFKGERNAYDEIDFDSMTIDVLDAVRTYHEMRTERSKGSEHLVLVLDRRLQAFPWESLPCLEGLSVSRVGSLLSLRDCILSMRQPNTTPSAAGMSCEGDGRHMVCRNSGTYVLNPSSDLAPTQAMLEPALSTLKNASNTQWTSIVNRVPIEGEFSDALMNSSVMLYFGHGGGSQYIRQRTIKRLDRCSEVVWLMGCSSGSVWENGDLEPTAIPLAYLLAGNKGDEDEFGSTTNADGAKKCKAVVATLWDVTDKDIDRFTLATGEDWGLWPTSPESKLPTKTPRKREIVAQPSTPVQNPKTPKTPKARKTPAIAKTPATIRRKPPKDECQKLSLAEAVARSRDVCVLRYLNGAAPVIYGVPVYLDD